MAWDIANILTVAIPSVIAGGFGVWILRLKNEQLDTKDERMKGLKDQLDGERRHCQQIEQLAETRLRLLESQKDQAEAEVKKLVEKAGISPDAALTPDLPPISQEIKDALSQVLQRLERVEVVLPPPSAESYFERGNAYYAASQWDEAVSAYSKAIQLGLKDAAAYANRGVAYAEKKDLDAAIADYSKTIELDPKLAAAYANRGITYTEKKDLDAAIADYSKAIELDPKLAAAYSNRGIAYTYKKEFDAAFADYDKVIQLDPKDAVAYYNRACAHSLKEDVDRACADLAEAISLNEKYSVDALTDTDFDRIRDDPRFKAVVEKGKVG